VRGLERGKQRHLIAGRRRHDHIDIGVAKEDLDVVACTVLHLLGLLLGQDHAHHVGLCRGCVVG
jgi:hypothetical protein